MNKIFVFIMFCLCIHIVKAHFLEILSSIIPFPKQRLPNYLGLSSPQENLRDLNPGSEVFQEHIIREPCLKPVLDDAESAIQKEYYNEQNKVKFAVEATKCEFKSVKIEFPPECLLSPDVIDYEECAVAITDQGSDIFYAYTQFSIQYLWIYHAARDVSFEYIFNRDIRHMLHHLKDAAKFELRSEFSAEIDKAKKHFDSVIDEATTQFSLRMNKVTKELQTYQVVKDQEIKAIGGRVIMLSQYIGQLFTILENLVASSKHTKKQMEEFNELLLTLTKDAKNAQQILEDIDEKGKETLEEIANKAKEKLTELQKDAQIVKNEFAETKRQAQEAKDLSAPLLTFIEKIRDVTTSPFENLFGKIQLVAISITGVMMLFIIAGFWLFFKNVGRILFSLSQIFSLLSRWCLFYFRVSNCT